MAQSEEEIVEKVKKVIAEALRAKGVIIFTGKDLTTPELENAIKGEG